MEFMKVEVVVSTVSTTLKVLTVRNAKPTTIVLPMFLITNMMLASLAIVILSDQSTTNASKTTLLPSTDTNLVIASVNQDSEAGDARNVLQDSETTQLARNVLVIKLEVSTLTLAKRKIASANRMSRGNSVTSARLELSS